MEEPKNPDRPPYHPERGPVPGEGDSTYRPPVEREPASAPKPPEKSDGKREPIKPPHVRVIEGGKKEAEEQEK